MIKFNDVEVNFEKYPNQETRFTLAAQLEFERYYSRVEMRYEDDQDLFDLMLVKKFLDDCNAETVVLRVSHMPYARMDRAPWDVPFTLKYVCEFINDLGFDHIEVIDPHSDVCVALLNCAREISVIEPLLANARYDIAEPVTLVFPDAGAQKKYERLLKPGEDYFFGVKHRNFANGNIDYIQVHSSDSGARAFESTAFGPAVIVDDLCSRGGTFIGTADSLRKQWGFDRIYLVVAHCEPVAYDNPKLADAINHVYTTDSMPWGIERHPGFTRYSQSELLKEIGE